MFYKDLKELEWMLANNNCKDIEEMREIIDINKCAISNPNAVIKFWNRCIDEYYSHSVDMFDIMEALKIGSPSIYVDSMEDIDCDRIVNVFNEMETDGSMYIGYTRKISLKDFIEIRDDTGIYWRFSMESYFYTEERIVNWIGCVV